MDGLDGIFRSISRRNPKETPLAEATGCEMRQMLGNETCDVTLVPSREPSQKLGAHKCTLAMRSVYFQELFSRPARCCSKPQGQVVLENLTLTQLQALLGFIYADEWTDDPFFAREMLPMASRFEVSALRGLCEKSLVGALEVESCAEILALADEHGQPAAARDEDQGFHQAGKAADHRGAPESRGLAAHGRRASGSS